MWFIASAVNKQRVMDTSTQTTFSYAGQDSSLWNDAIYSSGGSSHLNVI